MKESDITTLFVDYSHIVSFDVFLAQSIAEEFYRYVRGWISLPDFAARQQQPPWWNLKP